MRFVVFCFALTMTAHDLYVMPRQFQVTAGGTIEIALHNGDDFPDSAAAPRLERLVEPRLIAAGGTQPLVKLRTDGKVTRAEVRPTGTGTMIVTVQTKPNAIELEAPKFLSYLKHEGLRHVIAAREKSGASDTPGKERYSKYVKSLVAVGAPSDFYQHVVGLPIEILPLADPGQVRPGGKLPIQVLFRGKPAADLQIEMAWLPKGGKAGRQVAGRTDARGQFTVPIGEAGTWKLHTLMMERCAEPAFDWESFWASLTFEISPR